MPTGLTVTPGNLQATLTWNASPGAATYTIRRTVLTYGAVVTQPDGTIPTNVVNSFVTTTNYTDTGLANNVTYAYTVSAANANGQSAASAPVSATPLPNFPTPPTGLAATVSSNQVNLSWNPVSGAADYVISRATALSGPYTALDYYPTALSIYSDAGLNYNTTYYYEVASANLAGIGSNSAPLAVEIGPPSPASIAAVPGNARVSLSWSASPGATNYVVQSSTVNGGPYATILNTTNTSCINSNLVNGTTYYYVVYAVSPYGQSSPSPQASATPSSGAGLFTWINTVTTSPQGWNANGNWSGGTSFPNAMQSVATVNSAISANQTIDLNQAIIIGTLNIGAPGGAAAFNVTGNGGTFMLNNSPNQALLMQLSTSKGDTISAPMTVSGGLLVTNASANPFTVSGNITGATNGITVSGSVTLSGNNSFTGGITLNSASTLQLQANAGNTSAGISSVMPAQNMISAQLPPGSTIQLRADSSVASGGVVAFDSGATEFGLNATPLNTGTYNFDVNQLTTGSTPTTLQFGPQQPLSSSTDWQIGGSPLGGTTTINVTGGDGYTLQLGGFWVGWNNNLVLNLTNANLIVGGIGNGSTGSITKNGAGMLTLTNNSTIVGVININGGTMNFTNGTTTETSTAFAQTTIANTAGSTGTLSVSPGAGFTDNAAGAVVGVGYGSGSVGVIANAGAMTIGTQYGLTLGYTAANSSSALYNTGAYNQTGGSGNNGILDGNATGSYGYVFNTGTLTEAANLITKMAAASGSCGVMDVAGGTMTVTNGANLQINSSVANTAQDLSQLNITGGTLTAGVPTAGTVTVNSATGATGNYASINVSGGSAVFTTTGAGGINLNQTSLAANVSTLSLANGGALNTSFVQNTGNAASTGVLSLNGGTLTATAANGSGLIQSGVTAYVFNGGVNTINNGGLNVSIPAVLSATAGNGVTGITLGGTLTNYIGAPVVKISGGGGKGAAAIATFNPATGTITGITITSPGSGYPSAPAVTLIGGSATPGVGAAAGSATATATIGAVSSGGITFSGAGTTTLSGANTYTGATSITNGTLALINSGAIANSSGISISSGALFDVSGTTGGSMTLAGGKTLSGNGSVKGNFTVGSGAILSPGSLQTATSIGTLTFSNSLTLNSGSTNIFGISNAPLTNDVAKIFGALTNGGTLIVTNTGAAALAAGNSFKLFNAASYSGAFASVILPPLPAGLAWNTNSLSTNGTLSVVVATKPFIASALISGNGFMLTGTGGVADASFYLLGSTNVATPVSNWTRLLTNQFDNSGNFNFTNAINSNNAQSFYLLQLQ